MLPRRRPGRPKAQKTGGSGGFAGAGGVTAGSQNQPARGLPGRRRLNQTLAPQPRLVRRRLPAHGQDRQAILLHGLGHSPAPCLRLHGYSHPGLSGPQPDPGHSEQQLGVVCEAYVSRGLFQARRAKERWLQQLAGPSLAAQLQHFRQTLVMKLQPPPRKLAADHI